MTFVFVGDSIARGVGDAAHAPTYAHVSAKSCEIVGMVPEMMADTVVISAGVNDSPGYCLGSLVDRILNRMHPREIVWILSPAKYSARAHQAAMANARHDRTVSYVPGHDGLHPRSYPELACALGAMPCVHRQHSRRSVR